MDEIKTTPISRRRFLARTALAAGAGTLLHSGQTSRAEAAQDRAATTLTVMYNAAEISRQEIQLFEKQNPGITVKQLEFDPVRLSAMLAASQPPDFIRSSGAGEMPNLIARGLPLDLTHYFATSKVLKPSDLMPINNVYRWDGKTQGRGPIYGMVKDWSQDAMLWYNKKLFARAKVKYPSGTEPLSFDELLAVAKKVTVRKGGRILAYGLDPGGWGGMTYGQIIQNLEQEGKSLWNSDYTEANFTSPEARRILKWYVDWAQAHVGPSPLDPYSGTQNLFTADRLGMEMFGYWWHGGIIANNPGMIKYAGFAPAPQWGSKRISACFFGTGAWIPQNSKNKAAAWRFMEYFGAGQPAYDRAISGWGLPAVKQYWKDVPHSTPYDKDFNRVQQNELRYLQILHFPPYITNDAMEAALLRYMLPVFKGQTKLEVGAQQLEAAVNKLLQLGKSQVGS